MFYRQLSKEEYSDLESRILYEDNHILIFNKKSGEIVQGDKTGDEPLSETLKAFIANRDDKPGQVFMGVPHRLDRPVSGIVVFAKTSKALERLAAMFRDGNVHKTYWALCCNAPAVPEGELQDWMVRNEKQNKSYITRGKAGCQAGTPALQACGPQRPLPPAGSAIAHRPPPPDPLPAFRYGMPDKRGPQIRRATLQQGRRHLSPFQKGEFHSSCEQGGD